MLTIQVTFRPASKNIISEFYHNKVNDNVAETYALGSNKYYGHEKLDYRELGNFKHFISLKEL